MSISLLLHLELLYRRWLIVLFFRSWHITKHFYKTGSLSKLHLQFGWTWKQSHRTHHTAWSNQCSKMTAVSNRQRAGWANKITPSTIVALQLTAEVQWENAEKSVCEFWQVPKKITRRLRTAAAVIHSQSFSYWPFRRIAHVPCTRQICHGCLRLY